MVVRQTIIRPLLSALLILFLFVLIRNAYVSDDAFISLRTVDHVIEGYGLRWNVFERVQSFTHPAWLLLLTAVSFVTRELYYTTIGISIASSLLMVWILVQKISRNSVVGLVAVMLLIMSKAFVDFSVSGLENPLTHLLLVALIATWLTVKQRRLFWMSLLASVLILTRHDLALLILPLMLAAWSEELRPIKRKLASVVTGFMPFIVWTIFSLLYYGFPFPNTAYAKLNVLVPKAEMIGQGSYYLANSIIVDPITMFVICYVFWAVVKQRNRRAAIVMLGSFFYLLYIVYIGGDFMTGRFLTPVYVASIAAWLIIYRDRKLRSNEAMVFCAVPILLCLISPLNPLVSNIDYQGQQWSDGMYVGDDRGALYKQTGLLRINKELPNQRAANRECTDETKNEVVEGYGIGMRGFFGCDSLRILDHYALSDALLARIPSKATNAGIGTQKVDVWRPGHFYRDFPCGYVESVESGENMICDRSLALYYEKLLSLTQDPIFSWQRLKNIIGFNIGRYDYLINNYIKYNPDDYNH